jgi:diacylglycerol kinase (ATP)
VVIIKPMSKVELVKTYPKLYSGRHVTHPQYEHHLVRSVTVAAPGVVAYADGERLGALPLTVEVVPRALRVLVPR